MNMIVLPTVIDRTTAGALTAQIDQALKPGGDVVVEGRDVARIGQCGIQLMLSAQLTAQTRSVTMPVHASEAMAHAAETAGLASTFTWAGHSNDQ